MDSEKKVIALEARLKDCHNVVTLGVKTNFNDYSVADQQKIRHANKIYYPSSFYAELFDTIGKKTFPSYHTYKFVQDKIKQSALFDMLGIPHPRTRVYYGNRQKSRITEHFNFPFIAKVPRGSAMGRGVFLIRNTEELIRYAQRSHPAYIQEYHCIDRDIRVVVIGNRIAHAYWRLNPPNEFRSNVSLGGRICLDAVPAPALKLALHTAHAVRRRRTSGTVMNPFSSLLMRRYERDDRTNRLRDIIRRPT